MNQQTFARLFQMSIAHIEGESDAYLKCVVNVDASVEECSTFSFTLMSRNGWRGIFGSVWEERDLFMYSKA